MGFVGDLFGSSSGMGWRAQGLENMGPFQQTVSNQDLTTGQALSQEELQRQRAFTTALQAQTPGAIANQQMVAQQLAQQAQGLGPSVAQTQLNQALGQNVAGVGAALAGGRGASANVGLTQRNIASMGAQAGQQAAGQASTLRANEQLAAQQALSNLAGTQIGQVQQAGLSGLQAAQQQQQMALQAATQANAQRVAMQSNINAANAAIAQQTAQGQAGMFGKVLGGAGALAGMPMAAGGQVPSYGEYFSKFKSGIDGSSGVEANTDIPKALGSLKDFEDKTPVKKEKEEPKPYGDAAYQKANLGVNMQMPGAPQIPVAAPRVALPVQTQMPLVTNPVATSANIGAFKPGFAEGGKVPAMLSPGERYLPPQEVEKVKEGKKEPVEAGKKVPGTAKVKGDSLKNDTVPATLEEGGIVIPRSVMQSKDPAEKAREFVAAVLAKQRKRK